MFLFFNFITKIRFVEREEFSMNEDVHVQHWLYLILVWIHPYYLEVWVLNVYDVVVNDLNDDDEREEMMLKNQESLLNID